MGAVIDELRVETFRVCSVEDNPDSVLGTLESLRIEGILIDTAESHQHAVEMLQTRKYNLVVIDQQLWGDNEGGTRLIAALKRGEMGDLNTGTPFVFLTGSREWVTEAEDDVVGLPGWLDEIVLKGSALTPRILDVIRRLGWRTASVSQQELFRVPALISKVETDGVYVLVPARDPDQEVYVSWDRWSDEALEDLDLIAEGRWVIIRMNILETDEDNVFCTDLEPGPEPDAGSKLA
jgi:CheY-like chemotaxis protein